VIQEVLLLRHGQSFGNLTPEIVGGRSNHLQLTAQGVEQAWRLGKFLLHRDKLPDRIVASPAVRTRHTAEVALNAMGLSLDYEIDDRLQELSNGDSEGQLRHEVYNPATLAEIARLQKDFKLPNGDSMNEVASRMSDALQDAVQLTDAEELPRRVLIFGHGQAFRCWLGEQLGWSHAETRIDRTPNTSITRTVKDKRGWFVRGEIGQVPHLVLPKSKW
jgi:broad specificity phosphatase PhoE